MIKKKLLGICVVLIAFSCSGDKQTAQINANAKDKKDLQAKENCIQPTVDDRQVEGYQSVLLESPKPSNIPAPNSLTKNMEVPEGMIFLPTGETVFGNNHGLGRERPQRKVKINGFFIDKNEVTVAQYRAFVKATSYVTEAEKFGNSGVYDLKEQRWKLVDGANWEYPLGKSAPKKPDNHPVTQVSWNDAVAYCKWAGKRLPTEQEWEYAAKCAGTIHTMYTWGDSVYWDNKFQANTYNGVFPYGNSGADGYLYTSPVGEFGENPIGLTDMLGNVWEWCDDFYRPFDPQYNIERIPLDNKEKVQKGGSFMCDHNYCHGFRTTSRSGTSPETGLFHVGFRCVKDVYTKK